MREKERESWERKYTLPETPHIIVHPSATAKSGRFDCTVMSLSILLDYRPEDNKEHSFEVCCIDTGMHHRNVRFLLPALVMAFTDARTFIVIRLCYI